MLLQTLILAYKNCLAVKTLNRLIYMLGYT